MTDSSDINWQALEKLRASFLSSAPGGPDYWQDEAQLASYDATFAQRIGWKWDYVLAELAQRGWTPPGGELLDWGCGSGIASRAFLDHFGAGSVSRLHLWDRSSLARDFALKRAREKYAGLEADAGPPEPSGILLLSHVLSEQTPEQIEVLLGVAANATSVLWVEPGTYDASLTLIAVREKLRAQFNVVAPCTHQARCGILAPQNQRHWCHHFAAPPPGVFTDGNWSRFGKMLGIDLRDLPLGFLVLDKRPAPALPPGATRVIGHPRIYKPHALLLGCDDSGVCERKLTKRTLPNEFKRLKKGDCDPLQVWNCEGDEIVSAAPLPAVRGA